MVSSFATQLQAIASKSSHELDLKARRNAHAESLLFDPDVAAKQDFETIYSICIEGFRELCYIDSRFHEFDRNLFAEQAKTQDREELNRSQNDALDLVIRRCLMLLGPRILLKPALKALEWLLRRFRVHVHNIDDLLLTLLPYHEVSVWANTLSIIPNDKIIGHWKHLRPYLKTTWNIPRHALAHAASHNDAFFASLNTYALSICRQQLSNNVYMTFWSGIIVEAISTRLAQTRSGRKEVQKQRVEDLLLKILPLLSEGYEIAGSQDLVTTCYTVTIVLAAKAELADHLLDSLLLAVCQSLHLANHERSAALITASVVVSYKEAPTLPKKVLDEFSDMKEFSTLIRRVSEQQSCRQLLAATIASILAGIKRKNARKLANFALDVVHLVQDLYPDGLVDDVMIPIVSRVLELSTTTDATSRVRGELVNLVQRLNESPSLSDSLSRAIIGAELDTAMFESLLGMAVNLSESTVQDIVEDTTMTDRTVAVETSKVSLDLMPLVWNHGSSFLAHGAAEITHRISQIFEDCATDSGKLEQFARLPLWTSTSNKSLLWQTFLLRFSSSTFPSQTRQKALQLLIKDVREQPACHVQFFVPYAVVMLTDVKAVRQGASNLLSILQNLSYQETQETPEYEFYDKDAMRHIAVLSQKQSSALLTDLICPVLEECVLDQSHIVKVIRSALQAQTATDMKKSHRQALFSLLAQHALATPLLKLKVAIVSTLNTIQKVGTKSKTKSLLPILQEWWVLSAETAKAESQDSGFSVEAIDAIFVQLTNVHDGQFLDQIAQTASPSSSGSTIRPNLIKALFEYMCRDWNSWTVDEHVASIETLFNMSFAKNETLSSGAQELLRSVDLSSEALATVLQLSQIGSADVKGPPSKKKRRSSSGASQSRIDVARSIDTTTAKMSFALELIDSNTPESRPELATVMFEMLACLKQLQQNRVESPYLLNLCLSSIHAMIISTKARGKSTDISGIKPELVTECLRTSDNPQVQNSALIVLAALSSVVPDRMVHNVMPIFTFIGHNMLSKEDEHSINVVNEAIDKIVPALLQSLRKGNNLLTYQISMSAMLANFTSAYDHIPRHRRVAFYQKLLFSIEADEFGFILIALLAAQQGKTDSFAKFLEDVSSALSPANQLIIYRKLVELSVDAISVSPQISTVVFNLGRNTPAREKLLYAKSSLAAGTVILRGSTLTSGLHGRSQAAHDHVEQANEQLKDSFETTLRAIKDLKDADVEVQSQSKQCLDALLSLPKMADLLQMLQATLDEMEETQLRPQALRILSLQLRKRHQKDAQARELSLSLIQKLNTYIDPSQNSALIQASLVCTNSIVEIYGRRDPEVVFSVVENIVRHGLAVFKPYPKVLEAAILTTASVVEVIKELAVPLVSNLISQSLSVIQAPPGGRLSSSLLSAACALLSAVISNIAFIVSQDQLIQILSTVFIAKGSLDIDQDDADVSILFQTMAQKVDLELLLGASRVVLQKQAPGEETVAAKLLDIVNQAIEISPKSAVMRQADSISQLFEVMLDSEAHLLTVATARKGGEQSVSDLSSQLKETSIKFIYKINDTTFRPIFESWVEWATMTNVADETEKSVLQESRQIALFELLIHFFDNLKAIVTSYATYVLPSISTILKSATAPSTTNKSNDNLLVIALTLLQTIAIHDQDSFFSAPSNFEPIAEPLVSTLRLAATKAKRQIVSSHVIPAIIALATATMDSPITHSALVHSVVGFKPHPSARVRLASIQTLLALTEDEEVGDEFLANTIGIGVGEGEGARGGGSSVGEIMIYVNEMLEDDDEDVEREVRRWVQLVRSKVGEDVFEV